MKALATIAAAPEQSQPGMFTALSARENTLLALLGMLACLPGCWRQPADNGRIGAPGFVHRPSATTSPKAGLPSLARHMATPIIARPVLDTQGN